MKLTITNLENCFNHAKDNYYEYVGVVIEMSGFESPEVIINPSKNFESKLNYYKNAYNEDLTLKNAPDKVRIVGFTYGDSFKDIADDLL